MAHEVHLLHSRASNSRKWGTLEKLPQALHEYSSGTVVASLIDINSVLDLNSPPLLSKAVVLVCDPSLLEILGQRRDRFAGLINHISSENIKLVILRVHGVSTDTLLEIAPPLRSFVGQQLCVDFFVDRDEDVEKITEAIFEKLFGYIVPRDPDKDGLFSNDVWNTQGCLAANQIPTQPPCVNQNQPDGGSLAGCALNNDASSRTADDVPDMEPTEPQVLRERMEEIREGQRTFEILRGASYSKSQSYPENQVYKNDHIAQSAENRRLQHGLQNQDRASPHMSVEESFQASAGSATVPNPVGIPRNSTQATAVVLPGRRNTPGSGSLSQSNQSYSQMKHAQEAPKEQTIPKTVDEAMLNDYLEQYRAIQREQRVPPLNTHTRIEFGYTTGPPADMETSPSNNRLNQKVKDLREDILDELSMYLDPHRHGMKNWRCFASFMGIKCAKIDYLESKGDPTRAMLKLQQFRSCTVGQFKDLCLKYERFDVLEDVFDAFGY